MNNKDLFEAIDRIDDDIINSAGKYLKPEGFIDTDPVEVLPASKKTSMIKMLAPIAAALAVVCGVTLVARTQRPFTANPGMAVTSDDEGSENADISGEASETSDNDETSDISDSDETSNVSDGDETSNTSDTESTPDIHSCPEDELPFGPDGKQLTFDDIGGWKGNLHVNGVEQPGTAGVQTGFAYIAEPSGANYNSADNPEAFADGFTFNGSTIFKRISDDNHDDENFGNFNVFTAHSEFYWASEDSNELVYQGSNLCLYPGHAFLENVYLVRSDDEYYIIARNGETHLPSVNLKQQDDGSYALVPYSGNISGLEYLTETPPIRLRLRDRDKSMLDNILDGNSYYKARILIENVQYFEYPYREDVSAFPMIVSIQRGSLEPKEVAAFINTQTSASELKTALMEKYGFTDVVVVFNFSDIGIDITLDTPVDPENAPTWGEDELIQGMAVKVYDENGLCGVYTYGDYK